MDGVKVKIKRVFPPQGTPIPERVYYPRNMYEGLNLEPEVNRPPEENPDFRETEHCPYCGTEIYVGELCRCEE